ncbi:hypothetical protein KAR28_03970 [Candidatus Parcubacteria bacterium]|nr:hypothetical protein [Candidatus Parcubacteria bacterium]
MAKLTTKKQLTIKEQQLVTMRVNHIVNRYGCYAFLDFDKGDLYLDCKDIAIQETALAAVEEVFKNG